MKILAIMGSPRLGGNTDILTDKALEGASSQGALTEKLIISSLDIAPCSEEEYHNVDEEGFSVVKDDLVKVYNSILDADIILISSPVFFGSLSAQIKALIDRFQFAWLAQNMLKKNMFPERRIGGFICAGAQRREDYFENSKAIVRHFFATINVECREEEFFAGVDQKASVLQREDLLSRAYDMGRRLIEAVDNVS